jgi:hypothetical protein
LSEIREQSGTWVFLAPIANLTLTTAVNYEFRINRVTFVRRQNLARRRRRFGLPDRISELERHLFGMAERFFDRSETFATLRQTGKLADFETEMLELIREELAILTLSQLGYGHSRPATGPAIGGENPRRKRSHLALNADRRSWTQPNWTVSNLTPLVLDESWKQYHRRGFFFDLLRIIRGEVPVAKGWRRDLRNAAILAGQSQASTDLPQAFLWNVIALELLLTTQGDTYTEALPARAEAFLGWVGFWKTENFEARIREIYRKRSEFVHTGRRDRITPDDLLFSDDLLFNLFVNLVAHHETFGSKEAIISFSKRVQAEHLLGIDAKVRPKTLSFTHRHRSADSYRR